MKTIEWDLTDKKRFGWQDGNVRLGSGLTFAEVGHSAAKNKRMVAEGWTHSVGVAGWHTGGGHGPFAGWAGLGVDNLLEAELVTADGTLCHANATHNKVS
jgi:ribonuclease T2